MVIFSIAVVSVLMTIGGRFSVGCGRASSMMGELPSGDGVAAVVASGLGETDTTNGVGRGETWGFGVGVGFG